MVIQERYTPIPMIVDGSYELKTQASIGGFIAVTGGTITVTAASEDGLSTKTLLNAFPLEAGTVYKLAMFVAHGASVLLAGGASGTLLQS